MPGIDLLITNLLSPIVLAFVLGIIAGVIKSELELPEPVLKLLAIYLLFSIGLKGGTELAAVSFADIAGVLGVTIALTIAIPIVAYFVLRKLGNLSISNAAAVAAHYGSVSSVTFFASIAFAKAMNTPSEGFMTAVVALMEWGVIIALILARWAHGKQSQTGSIRTLAIETLRGRGILLLTGGMVIGMLAGERGWKQISPFYDDLFRGILMLFLLEMGMTAARQFRAFAKVGKFMTGFALLMPICMGLTGVWLGYLVGLSLGGAFVLGAVCASSSYIDAPAACRASLPDADPGIYLTASLGITFPFNIVFGLPAYYQFASFLYR
ncbi:MAG: sodium-dependent bicarbonate transport family permease [Burkholderiales bacterium]|jgi:hypothetical protein|nr:sodium-dependent bicarbonate transport family permease [Nitrosomonadaceae bacterium]